MAKSDKLNFRNESQKRLFTFLLKVAQNTSQDEYLKFEGRAKAVLDLPSIRAEYSKNESFTTAFKSSASQFLVKVEFWLRTVYLKIEDEKINNLLNIAEKESAKAMEKPELAKPHFDFLLVCMATEPSPKVYAYNIAKEREEKKLMSVGWEFFD